jgi:hypothetical protein
VKRFRVKKRFAVPSSSDMAMLLSEKRFDYTIARGKSANSRMKSH